jgi:hypothetical protein
VAEPDNRIDDLGKAVYVGGRIAVNSLWGFTKALSVLAIPLILTGVAAYASTWLVKSSMSFLARGGDDPI